MVITELRVKWFIVGETGQTKDPGRKLFRKFQSGFLEMETRTQKEDLVRLDLAARPDWMQDLGKELLSWATELYSKAVFPRDDYKELLGWVIWHLGGEVKGFWPLNMPGPDHQARWMADCIYYPKLLACKNVFKMTREEEQNCENITEFIIFFYARPWFECTLAGQAAVSDLTFLCHIQRRYPISKVWKVLETWYRQRWYLTGEMIPLALMARGVPAGELEALAMGLHRVTRGVPRLGKPIFPEVAVYLTPHPMAPPLASFVTSDSWAIFDRLGLDGPNVSVVLWCVVWHVEWCSVECGVMWCRCRLCYESENIVQDWLLLPADLWPLFPPYQRLTEFIRNLAVSNCIAERVISRNLINLFVL